eukprot:2227712-Pyramimonas_sp.AAC.1
MLRHDSLGPTDVRGGVGRLPPTFGVDAHRTVSPASADSSGYQPQHGRRGAPRGPGWMHPCPNLASRAHLQGHPEIVSEVRAGYTAPADGRQHFALRWGCHGQRE